MSSIVRVKRMVWIGLTCPTTVGVYRIKGLGENWIMTYEGTFPTSHESLDVAKAAAQEDYEARVLSALEPIPSTSPVSDALRQIANRGQSAEPDHWAFRQWARALAVTALKGEVAPPFCKVLAASIHPTA